MIRARGSAPRGARVAVSTRPLWVVRLGAEAPRYLVCAAALAGLGATARIVVAPPEPVVREQRVGSPAAVPDRGAEAFATGFVRRYLTWNADDPSASAHALEPYFGAGFEPDGGLELPAAGAQAVEWAEVVQARVAPGDGHLYTVAAQIRSAGVLFVSVAVDRSADGALSLAGYPAFVGAPSHIVASEHLVGEEITERALATVVQRALRNYLLGASVDLEADLARGAQVAIPPIRLSLETMQRPYWSGPRAVLAIVQARDARDVQYTLAYRLGVAREQGRWEITGVQSA
jgi:Conjugative transposon protein TcpC